MTRLRSFFLLIFVIGGLTGCEELGKLVQPNEPPIIDRIWVLRTQLAPFDTTTVRVSARDPEGEALAYSWRAEGGTLSSTTGSTVVWQAPNIARNYKITVKVRDERGKETEGAVTLSVLAAERPTVQIIQPANDAFIPGLGVFLIEAVASHPNGIQQVEFRVGNVSLGADNSLPYQMPWRVEGLSGPATIIATAFRAGASGEPGVDSVRVSIEGVTRW
jgi:hypothetical protein